VSISFTRQQRCISARLREFLSSCSSSQHSPNSIWRCLSSPSQYFSLRNAQSSATSRHKRLYWTSQTPTFLCLSVLLSQSINRFCRHQQSYSNTSYYLTYVMSLSHIWFCRSLVYKKRHFTLHWYANLWTRCREAIMRDLSRPNSMYAMTQSTEVKISFILYSLCCIV